MGYWKLTPLQQTVLDTGIDDTNYGAALRELDAIAAKMRDSDQKYGETRKSIGYYFPKLDPEKAKAVDTSMANLDDLYAKRRHTVAQLRYALHYRWALRKAGVNPNDVKHRFSSRQDKTFGPKAGIHVFVTEVELKDGRRVKIEPFEVPHELLKF